MRTRWSASTSGADPTGVVARAAVVVLALVLASSSMLAQRQDDARAILDRAIDDFLAGRVAQSVVGFDRVVELAPTAGPQLWQRGIALYYVGRYRDCRAQFESHRTVNPADVENPAWHFLCVARAESAERARAALLPVGGDPRRPMREIYEMFKGTMRPDAVVAAAGDDPSGQFYAELYVGLYYEATGDETRALLHLTNAANPRFARAGGYMYTVATLHPRVRPAGR
jgi:lipoprotein NlpI